MHDIRGLVFDKDGTLFDFRATWGAWTRALLTELTGGQQPKLAELSVAVGYDLDSGEFADDSFIVAHTPPEILERMLPYLPGIDAVTLLARMSDLAEGTPQVEAAPLRPLFSELRKAGYRIGLATNDFEAPARAHLARAGIELLFDFISGYDSGYGSKPEPGPLLAFAKSQGLSPTNVAMVGDSVHDLVAGKAAGMHTIAVLTGIATDDDLAPHADVVLPHIGHLPAFLAETRVTTGG